jgi:hypothetical protein
MCSLIEPLLMDRTVLTSFACRKLFLRTYMVLLAAPSAAADCPQVERRPFGEKAPWNVPVADLPRHPNGAEYVRRLWENGSDRPGNFNAVFDEYTYPVYDARNATGIFPIETEWESNLDGQTIPWNPSWQAASGTDAQVIVLDPEKGIEWDLWQVAFDGRKVTATNANRVPESYWTREVGFIPSRGAGIPYLAMLVRGNEVASGSIRHALAMPVVNTDGEQYFAPATKIEHRDLLKNGLPEGIRFALDVTDAEIEDWIAALPKELPEATRKSARTIARALRDYGWFVVDTAGAATLQFESRLTAGDCWKIAGLETIEIGDSEYPRDLMDGLMTRERIYALVPSDAYPAELRARPGKTGREKDK